MKDPTKDFNSSITRVRPILMEMLRGKESGKNRLRKLLNCMPFGKRLPDDIRNVPGEIESWSRKKRSFSEKGYPEFRLPGAFEALVPPSGAFLRWLIKNPDCLIGSPDASRSPKVRELRNALLDSSSETLQIEVREQALQCLNACGAKASNKQWWAFEGFSSVDCFIETDRLILFVEGKRTDSVSEGTNWVKERNQVARNLECARQYAAQFLPRKAFAVIVIAEEGQHEEQLQKSLVESHLRKSWKHCNSEVQSDLIGGFLGHITWQEVISSWKLDLEKYTPENVKIAIERFPFA